MESGKFFACGIRNPGLRNRKTAQAIRKPINDWNPESSSTDKEWNPVPRKPQSKTVLHSLTLGDMLLLQIMPLFFSLAPTVAPKTTRVPEVTPSLKVTPKPSGRTTVIVESSSNSGGQTNYTKNSKEEGIEHKSFFISFPYSL